MTSSRPQAAPRRRATARRRRSPAALALWAALGLALFAASPARAADVFSPGDLSRPHAKLSGLEHCTQCHPAGKQLSQEGCLACHQELEPRLGQGKGFHGKLPAKERDCWSCHKEHLGRDAAQIDWDTGGPKHFDHARTGVALGGKHAAVDCARCHDPRLPAGARLAPLLAKARAEGRKSYLGAPELADCKSCHSDDHRGQLGADCKRCHTDAGWKPARGFDHARTAYPLAGKHAAVECARCHVREAAPAADGGALVAAVSKEGFARFKPVAFASCKDCHADEHRGQLGNDCKRCHDEQGWKPARGFDHTRTAYPLTGKHLAVACARCHQREAQPAPASTSLAGPVSREGFARYRPVAFASCNDCHKDAHEGRFGQDCARCHVTLDWKQMSASQAGTGERDFHEKTRYPLRGAHAAAACAACHGPHPGQPARFRGLAFAACTNCHADAHAGQLAREGPARAACDRCHDVSSFLASRFGLEEHQQLAYPLQGAHRVVACAACHTPDEALAERAAAAQRTELARQGRPVRVSPALLQLRGDLGRCETCHADPHAGQLYRKGGCGECHVVASFRTLRFDHAKDSRFPLQGRHAEVACAACHRAEVVVPASAGRPAPPPAVRYRPLPLACSGCHADAHAGQLTGSCERCHAPAARSWKETLFQHQPPFTDYGLTGKHAQVACEKCHAAVQVSGAAVRRFRPLPRSCEACHADFHKGEFRGFEPGGALP